MKKKLEKHISDKDVYQSLPQTRKQVFFDLLKNRKMMLFSLSCLTFMFFIPLAVDLFYFNFLEASAVAAGKDEYLFSLIFYSMAILVPCMAIGYLGLGGAFNAAKKIVWQEGTMLSIEFFNGIKDNWLHSLINGFIFGIATFGLVVGSSYLIIFSPTVPVATGVGIGALILVFLTFGMISVTFLVQDVYYANSYRITLRNSFALLGLLNWKVLVTYLLTTCGLVALCAINFVTMIIGFALFAILNSLVVIIYTLMAHDAFDRFINKDHYPEMVGKGLYKVSNDKKEI